MEFLRDYLKEIISNLPEDNKKRLHRVAALLDIVGRRLDGRSSCLEFLPHPIGADVGIRNWLLEEYLRLEKVIEKE